MSKILFLNHYRCYRCEHAWTDEWSAMCDDDCPKCGARHCSPLRSEELPLFLNYYQCYRCRHQWTDEWSATCDDECPECEARACSPIRSDGLNDAAARAPQEPS